ncbi:MAG: NADH-quinone oxidoreductase subunit N [Actinobacteria bacterium]|nr:NADH-quinone oxidoreductase subunit N [Actinomycetota bacterium]
MTVLAQAIPEIPWAALSPELVLFGVGILVLLLETAGDQRVVSSMLVALVLSGGALLAVLQLDELILPALVILAALTQLALTYVWRRRPRVLSALLSTLGLLATMGLVAWQWVTFSEGGLIQPQSVLADMVAVDGVALFTRIIVCSAALVTIPLGWMYLEDRRVHRGEFYPLLLLSAVGMNLLASSADLIMVFIAIEVLSLGLYVMSGFATRDLTSQESAFKYFLLGAFSSAILLYGIALTYGVTGSTNIAEAGRALTLAGGSTLTLAAMGLLLVGFAFKTALVPFHMWTPDVYQGAPTPVTGFMAAGTKAAAFAAFIRVFVGAFAPLEWSWLPVVWTLAVITMLAGAILAVVQTDVKRMLGYSAIAHAGYAAIGLLSVNASGVGGMLFYLLVYAMMSVGAFGVLSLVERRQRRAVQIADLRGLWRRNPVPTIMLGLFLFSLAGIPGTAGFMAKLAVFRAGLQADQVFLVVVAVISSVIAAFFYLRVTVAMIMDDEPDELADEPPATLTLGSQAGLAMAAAVVVVLGVIPGVVVDLSTTAASLVR